MTCPAYQSVRTNIKADDGGRDRKCRKGLTWMGSQFGETYAIYVHRTAALGALSFLIAGCLHPTSRTSPESVGASLAR
jgi:hypothetical protein